MERVILVPMKMRISPLQEVVIGMVILLVKPVGQCLQRLLAVGDWQSIGALQIVVPLHLPRGFGDEIIV